MNKQRRQKINKTVEQIELLVSELEEVLEEERDSFGSIPENLQGSDRAAESEDAIDTMEDAIENIRSGLESLEVLS